MLKSLPCLLSVFSVLSVVNPSSALEYPVAHRDDAVVDDFYGTKVSDPYRWLESPDAPQTRQWVEAENALTHQFIDPAVRAAFRARLEKLLDYPRVSAPSREGGRYVLRRNSGLQPQAVVYTKKTLDGPEKVLFDPNAFSADGTVALAGTTFTEDGTLVAYGLSAGGSDEKTVKIRDVQTGQDQPDELDKMRFAGTAWEPGLRGLFYNQYPPGGRLNNKVMFHELGTPQADDRVVYERPDDPELSLYPDVNEDGCYLFVYTSRGTDPRNGLAYRELCCYPGAFGGFTELFKPGEAVWNVIDSEGPILYVYTDKNAPRRRLVKIDLRAPQPENWVEILPQTDDLLQSVTVVDHKFICTYVHDVVDVLKVFDKQGKFLKPIELPTVGSVGGVTGKREDHEMFFTFSSFTYPSTVFRYDFKAEKLEAIDRPTVAFDPDAYEAKQVFYDSKDGTRVPMFVVHKKGLKLDGQNPTVLYGYGGFNISLQPGFNPLLVAWLERGGVWAVANLRGGGEYGSDWHEQGMLGNKQNVFDDFIAAAQKLESDGYTSRKKLAIRGGSNGGLLVAAVMLQRPDLFGAVVCQVPVTDMLRFQTFGTGRFWTVEYGDATKGEDQFKWLRAYSPLHNVKPGATYPALLVTTAEGDDRVVPAHAFKFVATLQHAATGDAAGNVILLRHDTKSGHGAGKPTAKVLDEAADLDAFLAQTLGMDVSQ